MSDDGDFRLRPGRIRHDGGRSIARSRTFVASVLRATSRVGLGTRSGAVTGKTRGSRFGRGRTATLVAGLRQTSRRVIVKARIVRHRGSRYRAAPLDVHLRYLKRDGVERDGGDARVFDARSDAADDLGFADRSEDDRHHFRFIISPEDATELESLREMTRDLMAQAEQDLGTSLDWIAVDHWNTDNPHVHVLLRGVDQDGSDLVISRDYISHGMRARAEALASVELGPRSEREIAGALGRQVAREDWTRLDQTLRALAEHGVVDLRPGAGVQDRELQRLLIGRAQVLERLGLAELQAPATWKLKPGHEAALRALSERGQILDTLHHVVGSDRAATDLAPYAETSAVPVIGRLMARGLHDELRGEAFVVIDGVDGRVHHVRLRGLEVAGDTPVGGIVEFRSQAPAGGAVGLLHRSDLPLADQVRAGGATWLDRQLVAREPIALAARGFGQEVRDALAARSEHLVSEQLAHRAGGGFVFAKDLLQNLRSRELASAARAFSAETGLEWRPSGEGDAVSGRFQRRLNLASGRFAMIDDGLGFQLVPWSRQLEPHLGKPVVGVLTPGGVDWTLGRKRGLSL